MEAVYLSVVKPPLPLIVGAAGAVWINLSEYATACGHRLERKSSSRNSAVSTSCTTLENRADLYSPRNYFANGPYTRMPQIGRESRSNSKVFDPRAGEQPVSGFFQGGK